MSPDRLAALRKFFASVEPRLPHTVDGMFSRLLEAVPEAINLFTGDPEEAKARYLRMLYSIVQLTRSSQLWPVQAFTGTASIPAFAALRHSHARMHLTRVHFDKMKAALAQSFREDFPEEFTPEIDEALGFIFNVAAKAMTEPEAPPEEHGGHNGRLPHQDETPGRADFASYFGPDTEEEAPAAAAGEFEGRGAR